jgi:hypothetical protein
MFFRYITLFILCSLALSCANTKPSEDPKPQTMSVRSDASVSNPTTNGPTVVKPLFNIVVDNRTILVNNTQVKDFVTLEKLLAKHNKPVITIGTHKCLSKIKTLDLMSIVQKHTDTPIAYKSYGSFDDEQCKSPTK